MADYDRALDAQAELVDWWKRPANHTRVRNHLIADTDDGIGIERTPTDAEFVLVWPQLQSTELRHAPTYFVTVDLCRMVSAAAETMPAEVLLDGDAPTETGFAYFAEPLHVGNVPVRAILWRAGGGHVGVAWYADRETMVAQAAGRQGADFAVRWRQMASDPVYVKYTRYRPGAEMGKGNAICSPFAKAFWTICQQRLAVTAMATASRPVARRAARSGVCWPEVRVVTLRRAAHPNSSNGADVAWSHRWLVSGHWRNQWMPSREAHRLQWIPEHVKGPDDKPLVIRPAVFRVAR